MAIRRGDMVEVYLAPRVPGALEPDGGRRAAIVEQEAVVTTIEGVGCGAILSVLGEEVVMESWVFKMGREQGEKLGKQELLGRLYAKRLGRPITESEQATVLRRLGSLGYDRLVDVRDELSPEALAAWLAAPDAD
jgi:hypothetical protein